MCNWCPIVFWSIMINRKKLCEGHLSINSLCIILLANLCLSEEFHLRNTIAFQQETMTRPWLHYAGKHKPIWPKAMIINQIYVNCVRCWGPKQWHVPSHVTRTFVSLFYGGWNFWRRNWMQFLNCQSTTNITEMLSFKVNQHNTVCWLHFFIRSSGVPCSNWLLPSHVLHWLHL